MFEVGLEDFSEEEGVADGVGPRFNFVGCRGCHEQPAVGGTSPAINPLFRVPTDLGFAGNVVPSFITRNGPIREARFQFNPDGSRDDGVHALFVIVGHREAAGCQFATVPNDVTPSVRQIGAIENFANFQRFLAPPRPSPDTPGGATSIARGRQQFTNVGCAHCHTPTLKTPGHTTVTALANRNANLFSDLALHNMGPGLADDILQGLAKGDEFRTSPL